MIVNVLRWSVRSDVRITMIAGYQLQIILTVLRCITCGCNYATFRSPKLFTIDTGFEAALNLVRRIVGVSLTSNRINQDSTLGTPGN